MTLQFVGVIAQDVGLLLISVGMCVTVAQHWRREGLTHYSIAVLGFVFLGFLALVASAAFQGEPLLKTSVVVAAMPTVLLGWAMVQKLGSRYGSHRRRR